jgi:long-subunit fatty acid transport protein
VTADVQWSQWSSDVRNVTVYEDPYQAQLWAAYGYDNILMAWEDKVQLRFGAEYALGQRLALRAGYCHDPAPSPTSTLNILLPSFTYNTFTFGAGYTMSGLRLDACLEYMDGKERIADSSGTGDPGIYGMRMVIPSVSISYRF